MDTGTQQLQQVEGRLEVRNLSFVYPQTDKKVLDDISFVAEPGQMVALVGRSGSGKSTLANLIPRFYDHSDGEILLDGVEIGQLPLQTLRRHIALVTQQVSLFNDTVFNNIAYGDLANKTEDEVRAAAEAAFAAEFIERMPNSYQTLVGENGVLLSGGQRQRLAIARALLVDAPILLLDEATSALDAQSEHLIQQALPSLMSGRTTLVIAHRLATVQNADRIAVMDHGKLVAIGTHAELIASNPLYARLAALQFNATV